jgi:hypothetical protein
MHILSRFLQPSADFVALLVHWSLVLSADGLDAMMLDYIVPSTTYLSDHVYTQI